MICKFTLSPRGVTNIMVSAAAYPLTAQVQRGQPTIWVDTDPKLEQVPISIMTITTGESADPTWTYIGTMQLSDSFVTHAYWGY